MRHASCWFRLLLSPCLAVCVLLFAAATASAQSVSGPSSYVDHSHNFGFHGSIKKLSRTFLPSNAAPTTSITSVGNWSGFLVGSGSGAGFKQTTGNWNTPCTTGIVDHNHLVAQWVGLGGYYSDTLLQAGTTLLANGTFHIFYELYPNPPVISSQSFGCASSFTAEVDYNYTSTGANKNHIAVKNTSTGFTVDVVVANTSFQPDLQSSEWIDERPSCNSGLTDLADFNYLTWTSPLARTNTSGAGLGTINTFANTDLMMQDQNTGTVLAKPDGLNVDGTFKDRWDSAGSDGTC